MRYALSKLRISAIHVVPPRLPGVGTLSALLEGPAAALAGELRRQMEHAGITSAVAMGALDISDEDPLGVAGTLAIARRVSGVHAAGIADPARRARAQQAAGQLRLLDRVIPPLRHVLLA